MPPLSPQVAYLTSLRLAQILCAALFITVAAPGLQAQTAGLTCGFCPGSFVLDASSCTVDELIQTGSGCLGLNNCQNPMDSSQGLEVIDTGGGTFEARLFVEIKAPWNSTGTPNGRLDIFWNTGPTAANPTLDLCEESTRDRAFTYLRRENLTCAGTPYQFGQYSVRAMVCGGPGTSCGRFVDINAIDFEVTAEDLGCDAVPPKDECEDCMASRSSGCGCSGVGGKSSAFDGQSCNLGPGAYLRYRSGGAGGAGLPGSAAWRQGLGYFWSHDYAQMIVIDPITGDDSHVWLITEFASFREFTDKDAGGIYQTNSPSDEYRTLARTVGGWELRDLDGTVLFFNNAGRWTQTVDRSGNTTAGTYNMADQLISVSHPDQRTETFTYGPIGLLESITEHGVGGAGTPRIWAYEWQGLNLSKVTRPDGTKLHFAYDDPNLDHHLTSVTLEGTGAGQRVLNAWQYDGFGNVTESWRGDLSPTGANAVDVLEFSYDDPLLPTVTTVTDQLGNPTTFTIERDSNSNKPRIKEVSGDCPACGSGPNVQFAYGDPNHPLLPTLETDGEGYMTEYTYDANGQLTARTDAPTIMDLERTTTWTYSANFPILPTLITNPSVVDDGSLRQTELSYDPTTGDLLWREIRGFEIGASFQYRTDFTYNSAGQAMTIDPPGYGTSDQTSFTFGPARGNQVPATRTDPLIGTTSFGYDPFNNRNSVTDVNGVTVETEYDALDRVEGVMHKGDPGASPPIPDLVTDYKYNEFGDLEFVILPRGNAIRYGYDPAGRLEIIERRASETAQAQERTLYLLDGHGNRTTEALQMWNSSTLTWDTKSNTGYDYTTRCQLDRIIHGDGSVTEFDYDCNGNLTQMWDPENPSSMKTAPASVVYSYDELDRLEVAQHLWGGSGGGHAVTSYGYDNQDHLTSVTDAEGNTTLYEYSDRDLLTTETSPVSGVTTSTYNEHGKMTAQVDARMPPVTMTRTVDALDRVTLVDYTPGASLDTTYTYDDPGKAFSLGRLTAITRNGEAVEYTYDRFGRALTDGALGYAYDSNGNRIEVSYPDGIKALYSHDFADREMSLTAQVPGQADRLVVMLATYEPSGPLAALDFGSGLMEKRTYTARYFPDGITLGDGAAVTLLDRAYATDAVGNPTLIDDLLSAAPADDRTYTYQPHQYFLTQGDGPWGTRSWTYDQIGNRLTETQDGSTDTYSYVQNAATGNTSILTQVQLAVSGTRDYAYGSAGHLERVTAGANEILYTFDSAGRLSRLDRDAASVSAAFTYDGRSFMTLSSESKPSELLIDSFESGDAICWSQAVGGSVLAGGDCSPQPLTRSTYSSEGLLHHLAKQDGELGPVTDHHVFYLAGRPVAQLALDSGGMPSWLDLTTDHLGTPVVAAAAGGGAWEGGFEPFGADYSGAQAAGVFLRFPGQWQDGSWEQASLGVEQAYNVHRWYQAGAGRYFRPDPLTRLSSFSSLPAQPAFAGLLFSNDFSYTESNPVSFIDPTGLVSCEGIWTLVSTRRLGDPPSVSQRNPGLARRGALPPANHIPNARGPALVRPPRPRPVQLVPPGVCFCDWFCTDCDAPSLFTDKNLVTSLGFSVNTGGDPTSGDSCVCGAKPGFERGCQDPKKQMCFDSPFTQQGRLGLGDALSLLGF